MDTPAAPIRGKTFISQPYGWTSQRFYQFLIFPSALLHMLCEIQSSTSKGNFAFEGCMLSACKHCSDLIKFDFSISVVKPVLCLWANMAGTSISMCIWPNINASQKQVTFEFSYHAHFPRFSYIFLLIFMPYFFRSHSCTHEIVYFWFLCTEDFLTVLVQSSVFQLQIARESWKSVTGYSFTETSQRS